MITTPGIISYNTTINATKNKVWQVITRPEQMKVWMFDSEIEIISGMAECSEIIISGFLNDHNFENKGIITIFDPPKTFQYTSLSSLSALEDIPANYSTIKFQLAEVNDQTLVTFTQTNFPGKASYEHSKFYWGTALVMLKQYIETENLK